jgi:rod shape-determining protein MreD
VATNIHIGGMGDKKSFSLSNILLTSFIVLLLQIMLVPNIAINGIGPNLVLLGVVIIATKNSPSASCITGFFCGLIYDLTNFGPLGVMAFLLALAGYVIATISKQTNASSLSMGTSSNSWLASVFMFMVTALIVEIGYGLALSLAGYEISFGSSFIFRVLPSLLYDAVVALIVLGIRHMIQGRGTQKMESRVRR